MAGCSCSTVKCRARMPSLRKQHGQQRILSGVHSRCRCPPMQSSEPLRGVHSVWCILILIAAILAAGCSELSGTSTGRLHEAENSGDLRVYFLDVEQGDSALILFHDRVILIDAGEAEQGKRVVNDLKKLGVDHIDLLVATHPHSDHIGGMQNVIAAFPVDTLLDTGLPHTSPLYEHLLQTVDRQDIRYL